MKAKSSLLIGFFCITSLVCVWIYFGDYQFLLNPKTYLLDANPLTLLLIFCLLAADAFLPTPSSIIIISSGYLFGPWLGILISLLGLMIGNCIGFLMARYSSQWLEKKFPSSHRSRSKDFWEKWGAIALILSRPIPVLAECILFLSASTSISFGSTMFYCLLGVLPMVIVLCFIGFYALSLSWYIQIGCIIATPMALLLTFAIIKKLSTYKIPMISKR